MLRKTTITLLLLLAALFGLEWGTTRLLLKNINFKTAYITTARLNANILVNGPCVPEWMIDPRLLDSATGGRSYNLGLNQADLADNFLHLHLYYKYQPAPEYLFLYVSPIIFDKDLSVAFNTYRFSPFLNDEVVKETVAEMDPAYNRYARIPFMRYSYYGDLIYFKALQGAYYGISGRKTPLFPNGYEPPVEEWSRPIPTQAAMWEEYSNIEWDSTSEKYLKKSIQLAQKAGTKVVLYESPIFAEYLQKQPRELRNEMMGRIQKIADEHQVPFWKYGTLEMANDRANFFAPYNTTIQGALLFSTIFLKDVRVFMEQHPPAMKK